jgi:hypothetical protein
MQLILFEHLRLLFGYDKRWLFFLSTYTCFSVTKKRYWLYPAMTAFTGQYSLPNIFFLYWSVINRTYSKLIGAHPGILLSALSKHIGNMCRRLRNGGKGESSPSLFPRFAPNTHIYLYASTVHMYCIYPAIESLRIILDAFKEINFTLNISVSITTKM